MVSHPPSVRWRDTARRAVRQGALSNIKSALPIYRTSTHPTHEDRTATGRNTYLKGSRLSRKMRENQPAGTWSMVRAFSSRRFLVTRRRFSRRVVKKRKKEGQKCHQRLEKPQKIFRLRRSHGGSHGDSPAVKSPARWPARPAPRSTAPSEQRAHCLC